MSAEPKRSRIITKRPQSAGKTNRTKKQKKTSDEFQDNSGEILFGI